MRNGHVALKLFGLVGLASSLHLGCRNLAGNVDDGSGAGGSRAGPSAAGGIGGAAEAGLDGGTGSAADADGGTGGSDVAVGGALPTDMGGAAGVPDQEGAAGASHVSNAGGGGVAGASAASNLLGAAGINEADVDNLVPGCVSLVSSQSPVTFTAPHGLAVSTTGNSIPYVLYATQPANNTVTLRWKLDFDPDARWTPWSCFDFVPYPAQISAINIGNNPQNNFPEIYASTSLGKLYVRRLVNGVGWAPWQALSLPQSDSHVIDVAATRTSSTNPFLYVVDNGKLFVRHHMADDALSGYSRWAEISGAPPGASRVCAAVHPSDHRQQVFVLTTAGTVFDAVQQTADSDSAFGAFESSGAGAPVLSDIDCGYSIGGDITVFGMNTGTIWSLGATATWTAELSPVEPLRQFAVGSTPGAAPTVFGVGLGGTLYSYVPGGLWKLVLTQ